MLVTNIKEFNEKTINLITKAFNYLKEMNLENMEAKAYVLEGDDLILHLNEYETKYEKDVNFENHDHHLDLHYMIEGQEYISISRKIGPILNQIEENDVKFYDANLETYNKIHLEKGDFLLTAPKELHKPGCCVDKPQKVKKAVIKIKI